MLIPTLTGLAVPTLLIPIHKKNDTYVGAQGLRPNSPAELELALRKYKNSDRNQHQAVKYTIQAVTN